MKNLFIKISLLILVGLFDISFAQGQQFKWIQGGGTNRDLSSSLYDEGTYNMCSDKNGNIYTISVVGYGPVTADTFHSTTTSFGSDQNLLVSSYNCSGQMRWSKLISSPDGIDNYGITVDNSGHVYIAGYFVHLHTAGGFSMRIGNDTAFIASSYIATGVLQLDTNGNYKWIRLIGNNTSLSLTGVGGFGNLPITMDGANNAHFLCYIKSGVVISPSVTATYGVYDLVYNSFGSLLSAIRLDLDSEWFLHGAVIDPVTNKIYAHGEINQQIYGGFLADTFFAAAFDASGHRLWQYFCGHGDDDALTGITLDKSKHLHFSGAAQSTPALTPTTFSYNGDSVVCTRILPYYSMGVIVTTDTNGYPQWMTKFEGSSGINALFSIAQLPNNKVAAVGRFTGVVVNGKDSIITPAGEAQNPYLVIVDSAGDVQTIQQMHGDGFYDGGDAITADTIGNIYVGGRVEDGIWAGSLTPYTSVGGNTDFFIMKYGVDCNCTSMPEAMFTNVGAKNIAYNYTGATADVDSILWDFGDGNTAKGATASHIFSTEDTFHVCVRVFTSCGNDLYCKDIVYKPSLETNVAGNSNIRVFPNPANEELNITGVVNNTTYRLLTITGAAVGQGAFRQGSNILSMNSFAPGIYILEMTGTDGERNVVRVVKQ